MLFVSLLLSVVPSQLQESKEVLFTHWTTSQSIPHVTFGLPTVQELETVTSFVGNLRKEVNAGIASESRLSAEIPFMCAMLDGIAMEYEPRFAQTCREQLTRIKGTLTGIAASRVARMKLRSSLILGNEKDALSALKEIQGLPHPHQEDVVVATLFEIQQAFEDDDIEKAHALFENQDKILVATNMQTLRVPFASGYARIAPSKHEGLFGMFYLADSMVQIGYEQSVVDTELLKWFTRLDYELSVTNQSEDTRIVLLATRLDISRGLQQNNGRVLQTLMVLARAGNGRAAERVLEQGATKHESEAIALVLQYPEHVNAPLEYWQLRAAYIDIKNRNMTQATNRLTPLAKGSGDFQQQAQKLIDAIDGQTCIILNRAFDSVSPTSIPTRLKEHYQPRVIQDLLQQCIKRIHTEGETLWTNGALHVLLETSEGVVPEVLAEGHRLQGSIEIAIPLFHQAIQRLGASIQITAGLADCTHDSMAMQRVVNSTSPSDESAYWYWLSNVRLLEWYIEGGGSRVDAIAKVNRLRNKDASLGGAQFMVQFNTLSR